MMMPHKKSKFKWYLLFAVAWLALTGLPLAIYGLPVEQLRATLIHEFNRQTGLTCKIAALKLSWGSIRVEQMEFSLTSATPPFCRIREFDLAINWQTLKLFWTGETLILHDFTASGIFLDVDELLAHFARDRAAADAAVASEKNPAPSPLPYAPIFQLVQFSLNDLTIKMRDNAAHFAHIDGANTAAGLSFNAAGILGDGKISVLGNLQLLEHIDTSSAQQISLGIKLEKVAVAFFYRLFPNALTSLQKSGTASGDLNLTYSWQGAETDFGFSGTVRTENVVAFLFKQDVPLPSSVWDFAGSYGKQKLILDRFALTGETDSFLLVGDVDFVAKKRRFRLESEGFSWYVICCAAGNSFIGEQLRGQVYFKGFVNDNNGEVEITGEGGSSALIPLHAPFTLAKTVSVKSDFAYKSTDKIIRLNNIHLVYAFGQAAGALHFPWLQDLNSENFACDLAVESELAPLGALCGLTLKGKVAGNLGISSDDQEIVKYLAELQGVEAVTVANAQGEKLSLGKFAFQFAGLSNWRTREHVLEKLSLRSVPFTGTFNGAQTPTTAELGYNIQLQPDVFLPLLANDFIRAMVPEKFMPTAAMRVRWAKILDTLALRGRLHYAMATQLMTLSATELRGKISDLPSDNRDNVSRAATDNPEWNYLITANPQIDFANATVNLPDGELTILQKTTPQLKLTAKIAAAENHATISDLTLRTSGAILKKLSADFAALNVGGLAVNARITQTPNAATEYQFAANLADFRAGDWLTPIALTAQAIVNDNRAYNGELTVKKFILADSAKNFTIAGNANFDATEKINLTASVNANLAPCLPYLNFPLPLKLSGLLSSKIQLGGTWAAPALSLTASAPEVVIESGNTPRRLPSPEITFAATADFAAEVQNLRVTAATLTTPLFTFTANATAEKLQIEPHQAQIALGNGRLNYQLIGKREFLAWLVPELAKLVGNDDTAQSLRWSGTASATALPLTDNFRWLQLIQLDNGELQIDRLQLDKLMIKNLTLPHQLHAGIFSLHDGGGELGGKILFNSEIDFNRTPVSGTLALNADNLQLAEVLPPFSATAKIIGGAAFVPAMETARFLRATWTGITLSEILQTLTVPELTLRIDDLKMQTVKQKINWREVLKHDFHQSIADEIAKHLEARSAAEVGKKVVLWLKQANLSGKIKERCWEIQNGKIIGGDTADLLVVGKIFFDRRVGLRIYPLANLDRHFDISMLTSQPLVRAFIDSLPPEKQKIALTLLPNWLNQLAAEKKLYFDLIGTLDNLELDPQGMRLGIKAALPNLVAQITALAGESELLKNILNHSGIPVGKDGKIDFDLNKLF